MYHSLADHYLKNIYRSYGFQKVDDTENKEKSNTRLTKPTLTFLNKKPVNTATMVLNNTPRLSETASSAVSKAKKTERNEMISVNVCDTKKKEKSYRRLTTPFLSFRENKPRNTTVILVDNLPGCSAVPLSKAKKTKEPNEMISVNVGDTKKKQKSHRRLTTPLISVQKKKSVNMILMLLQGHNIFHPSGSESPMSSVNVGDIEKQDISVRRLTGPFLSLQKKHTIIKKTTNYTPRHKRWVSDMHSGVPLPKKMRKMFQDEIKAQLLKS